MLHNTMPPLFISYARVDVAQAEALEHALSSSGLATWRDKRDIEMDWSRDIAQALAVSSACCVIWTEHAAQSHWVRHEWLTARALGKPLHIIAPRGVTALPRPLQSTELVTGDDAGRWADEIARRTTGGGAPTPDYTIVPEGSWLPFLPDPRFTGRQRELVDLYLEIMGGLNAMGRAVLGLVALGGTGKTALAVEFSYRFSFGFDRVLWLQGADPSTWRQQLARLARDLVGIAVDPADDGAAVRKLGAALSVAHSLLVVDNVQDPRTLNREGVLGTDVPVTLLTLGASVLYTSRVVSDLAAGRTYALPPLEQAAATHLLTADREPAGADEIDAVAQILALTGGLPLALSLANAFLRAHADFGYKKFAAALRSRMFATLDSLGVSEEALATRHDVALSATLGGHVESLRDAHSKDVLTALAQYPEATIVPNERLEIIMNLPADADILVSPLASALHELERLRLAEPLGKGAVRLHPIVRSFVIEHTSETQRRLVRERSASNVRGYYASTERLLASYERRGLADVHQDVVDAAGWAPECGEERPWLIALSKVIERETLNLIHTSGAGSRTAVLQQFAWRYRDIGHPEAEVLEAALRDRGEAHVAAFRITPTSDPALLREASSANDDDHSVDHLAIHEASGTLVSWTSNRGSVWDLEKLQSRLLLEGGGTCIYALALTAAGDAALTVDADGVLREFDLMSGQIRRQNVLKLPRGSAKGLKPRACAITPDSRRIFLAFDDRETRPEGASLDVGHSVMAVWELDTDGGLSTPRVWPLRAKWLNAIGLNAEGTWLLTPGPENGTVDVLDAQTAALVLSLSGYQSPWKVQAPHNIVASSTLGLAAVQIAADVAVWDVPGGTLRHVHAGGMSFAKLVLDRDKRELLVAAGAGVLRCDPTSGRATRHYRAVAPSSLAIDATRRILVTGGPRGLLSTWDLTAPETGEGFRHASAVRKMVLHADGSLWLSLSDTELACWMRPAMAQLLRHTEQQMAHIDGSGDLVETSPRLRAVQEVSAFDADEASSRLLVVGSDGTWSLQRLDTSGIAEPLDGMAANVPYVACGFVDRGRLAVLVAHNGALRIINMAERTLAPLTTGMHHIAGAAFARDASIVALGSEEGRIEVLDIVADRVLWTFEHGVDKVSRRRFMYWNRAGEAAVPLGMSLGGRHLLVGFIDDRPMLVDLAQGRSDLLLGHQHIVWAGAIGADAGLIATGDDERRVIVWDLATRVPITQVFIDAGVSSLEFRNATLAIGDQRGRTYLARVHRARRAA